MDSTVNMESNIASAIIGFWRMGADIYQIESVTGISSQDITDCIENYKKSGKRNGLLEKVKERLPANFAAIQKEIVIEDSPINDTDMNAWIIPGLKFKEPSRLDKDMIIESICFYLGFEYDDIRRKNRKRELVIARQMVCYFLRKYTVLTLADIGKIIGDRDHTTVIHGIDTVNNFLHIRDIGFMKLTFDIETIFEEKSKTMQAKFDAPELHPA